MKKILFVIHTEYHLLFALKVICAYHNRNEDDILIASMNPIRARRLSQPLNFEGTNIRYLSIRYPNKRFQDKGLRYELECLIDEHPDILYVFHEHQKVFPYLFSKLKKTGTQIILCPDGANAYVNYTPLKERFWQFVFGNIYLLSNHFPCLLTFPQKHYAYRKELDAVIIEDKESYRNYTKKNVMVLTPSMYRKEEVLQLSNHIFQFNPKSLNVKKGSILWIDQPVKSIEKEQWSFLMDLHKKYPHKTIYFKPHPSSPTEKVREYEKIDGFEVIKLNMPMELLMENLDSITIISAFSTAMYYYNSRCKYYWVSALFKELPLNYTQMVPFKHINVVKAFEQIEL